MDLNGIGKGMRAGACATFFEFVLRSRFWDVGQDGGHAMFLRGGKYMQE